jgi:uncharacterized protein YuzE
MKVKYDKARDVLYISLSDEAIHESDEEKKGIIIDYTADGQVRGAKCFQAGGKSFKSRI